MTALAGRHASWSPAAPARSARPSSTSCSTRASAQVVVLDNLVRGRRGQPRRRAGHRPGRRWSRATSATATSSHDLTAGQGPGLPPGRDPDHPVRRGAAAGPRGAGRRHLQRRRGGRRRTASTRSSPRRRPRSTAWPRSSRPTERHHHHNNDTFYGAAKSFNEGMLRSFRAMNGLDYVALRYFNVYGPRMDVHGLYTEVLVRWMERIADGQPPLIFGDGLQTMDFVYTADIARANVLAATSRRRRGRLQHRQRRRRPACSSWPRRCCGSMDSDLAVEHGPERAVNGVVRRLADTSAAARDLGFAAEIGLEEGLRELVEWWRPLREEIAAGRERWRRVTSMSRINVMQPWLGEEEVAAVAEVIALRLGGAGAAGRRVRAARSPRRSRRRTPSRVAAARPRCTWRSSSPASGRATTSSCRRSRSSPPPTRPTYVGATPVFADVDPVTGNLTAETVAAALTAAHPRGDRRATRAACRSTSTRSGRCATRGASS